jgi:COP9 signalosome complex subunit 2
MADLRQSLEANDLRRFERILNNPANRILDEPLLMTYIQPLRRRMHEQVLLNITRPYQKASLQLIADELKYDVDEVESLLVDMILDGKLRGSIDQVNRCVILGDNRSSLETLKLKTTANWAIKLNSISEGFQQSINKMS